MARLKLMFAEAVFLWRRFTGFLMWDEKINLLQRFSWR